VTNKSSVNLVEQEPSLNKDLISSMHTCSKVIYKQLRVVHIQKLLSMTKYAPLIIQGAHQHGF